MTWGHTVFKRLSVFYLLGGTGGREKSKSGKLEEEEHSERGGFGPFGRRGRGSVIQSVSNFTVAIFFSLTTK